MKSCQKCGELFTPQKGLLNYCSLQCRNSRTFTKEAKLKKSIKSKKAWDDGRMDVNDYSIINNDPTKIEKSKETWINKYLKEREEGTLHSWDTIRKYHFIQKNYTCEVCGISEWNGESTPLELHHIDGNINNNVDSNLQVVCPNCHAQTDNYCGRNIEGRTNKDLPRDLVFDTRQEVKSYYDLAVEYSEMGEKPNGYHRKRHVLIEKYKISDGMMAKVISIYHKDPEHLKLIDNDEELTVGMVYRMLK
jgi:5-methylcytosine-specific restriction endonuclease McrA